MGMAPLTENIDCTRHTGKPLIGDLKILATEGTNGCAIQISGALATADNLGAHQLGGFIKPFSYGRVCRCCMILHRELDAHLCEEQWMLRHKDTYAYHLRALLENPDIAKSTYGVLSKCPLENLNYFSTVDNFVSDLMHDFLEGIVPRLIKLTLKQYHQLNIASFNDVNGQLANFSFGCNDDKSKPTQIPANCVVDEGSLPGKANEKWCLFRILPLLLSEYIPVDDAYWNLYFNMSFHCRLSVCSGCHGWWHRLLAMWDTHISCWICLINSK